MSKNISFTKWTAGIAVAAVVGIGGLAIAASASAEVPAAPASDSVQTSVTAVEGALPDLSNIVISTPVEIDSAPISVIPDGAGTQTATPAK